MPEPGSEVRTSVRISGNEAREVASTIARDLEENLFKKYNRKVPVVSLLAAMLSETYLLLSRNDLGKNELLTVGIGAELILEETKRQLVARLSPPS